MEIDEGRFVDLLEVDAASRTKVEDTRDLLENVQYAPTRGRYKVYLIDEVHMLSNHSFNALLKTLEEPPPHVKFLLATTDPQKLPVTILSRCLKFNLKFIPVDRIEQHLAFVLGQEEVPCDTNALKLVAKAAAGSMRDALSLLDQAIAHGSGSVREEEVQAMLGTLNRDEVIGVLQALANQDGAAVLEEVNRLAQFGVDFSTILSELVSLLHHVALVQISGVDESDDAEAIAALAQQISPEDIQLYYQIALQGLRDLPVVPDGRAGFEMIALRMLAFKPATEHAQTITTPPQTTAASPEQPAQSTATPRQNVEPDKKAPLDSRQAARANLQAVLGRKQKQPSPPSKPVKSVSKTMEKPLVSKPILDVPPPIENDVPPPSINEPPPVDETPIEAYSNGQYDTSNDDFNQESNAAATAGVNKQRPQSWAEVVAALPLNGMARQVAANSVVSKREGKNIYLSINASHARMASGAILQRLEEALSEFYQRPLKVHMEAGELDQETPAQQQERETQERVDDAVKRFSQDPAVQVMKKTFDAELDPASVKLID
jgi:DNA polymerase-3 subunit gamma/tau